MGEYGWGNMMDDYTFLEHVGRKVGEWGRDMSRNGLLQGAARGRGSGKTGRTGRGGRKTRRELLKLQLDLRDIEMELLPDGMERRKINQSFWDIKCICFIFT
jgi:hypothetical protein